MFSFVIVSLLLLLAISASFCAYTSSPGSLRRPRSDGRIVGGYAIDIKDAPYSVSVRYRGRHICGGSIIGESWILTAGHCTHGRVSKELQIRAGSTTEEYGGKLMDVRRIVQHPQYNHSTHDYDFALLELPTNIKFDSTMQAIKLPMQNQEYADGTETIVTGWGDTQNAEEATQRLRAVVVPIVNQKLCADTYRNSVVVTERMICAGLMGKGGKDTCQGDFGGALATMDDRTLVGVVSWGKGCAVPEYPGVYSRAATVTSWIKSKTGIM